MFSIGGVLSSLQFAVHIVTASKLIVLVVAASLEVLLYCMMLMSVTPCNLWSLGCLFYVSCFSWCPRRLLAYLSWLLLCVRLGTL
jgi:hypothetical protein